MLRMIHSQRAMVCVCLMPFLLSLTDSLCLISSRALWIDGKDFYVRKHHLVRPLFVTNRGLRRGSSHPSSLRLSRFAIVSQIKFWVHFQAWKWNPNGLLNSTEWALCLKRAALKMMNTVHFVVKHRCSYAVWNNFWAPVIAAFSTSIRYLRVQNHHM